MPHRYSLVTLPLLLALTTSCAAPPVAAGPSAPRPAVADVMRARQANIKDLLLRTADKMPADRYDYRLQPVVMSFGDLIVHIASVQMGNCAQALEDRALQEVDLSKTDKPSAQALLTQSFDYCERAFLVLSDDNASEPRGLVDGKKRPRFDHLLSAVNHNNLEYGKLSAYLRLNGVIPPSSDNGTSAAPPPTTDAR
jgi:hypothetical protein